MVYLRAHVHIDSCHKSQAGIAEAQAFRMIRLNYMLSPVSGRAYSYSVRRGLRKGLRTAEDSG